MISASLYSEPIQRCDRRYLGGVRALGVPYNPKPNCCLSLFPSPKLPATSSAHSRRHKPPPPRFLPPYRRTGRPPSFPPSIVASRVVAHIQGHVATNKKHVSPVKPLSGTRTSTTPTILYERFGSGTPTFFLTFPFSPTSLATRPPPSLPTPTFYPRTPPSLVAPAVAELLGADRE